MDGAGPFILGAMIAALVIGLLSAFWLRWWVAFLLATLLGELAFLIWIPLEAVLPFVLGFLPFAGVPAALGVGIALLFRKRAHQ